MEWPRQPEGLTVRADRYGLCWAQDRPYVTLADREGRPVAELFTASSVHGVEGWDDTADLSGWEVRETDGEIAVSARAESSVWTQKVYRFRCRPDRFVYEIEVEGKGRLTDVRYFGGYHSANPRWGSGFFWSGSRLKRGFNPEPSVGEVPYFAPDAGSVIDMTGVPLPGKGDWFFTPPPFFFAFEGETGWVGMGVEADPGENRYTEFAYHGQDTGFHLSLSYEGYTEVDGRYRLPAIGFDFADDEYEALQAHVRALCDRGAARLRQKGEKPAWWYEPIFCGWGAQCFEASRAGGRAPDFARQEGYDTFLQTLEANRVAPGIVVLDDKWQRTYGENEADEEKWPDLFGFISQRHAKGQKVLLWLKAWDAEGVPPDECITNAAGKVMTVDPTNPAYERRLRASVRRMLAPEGYDADGFKIDFSARIPCGPGAVKHGDAWGLELMRLYLGILRDEAKQVKPDALVMAHTPHPYLNDVVDMIRLNDINTGTDVLEAMSRRAKVASIACPDAVIDTDNWPITDKATWRDYLRLQPELGVPSLYFVSHVDTTGEALDAEDYALVRETWEAARHRRRSGSGA